MEIIYSILIYYISYILFNCYDRLLTNLSLFKNFFSVFSGVLKRNKNLISIIVLEVFIKNISSMYKSFIMDIKG